MVIQVSESLPCHMLLVRRLQMGTHRVEGSSEHPKHLNDVCMEPQPVKQPSEGVELPLQIELVC